MVCCLTALSLVLPGQIAFFRDKGNLAGFCQKKTEALDLATKWGYASTRMGFDPPDFDYQKLAALSGVKYVEPKAGERFSDRCRIRRHVLG